MNLVNVCTLSDADEAQIAAAVGKIPERPVFAADFEVARGRTTLKNARSDWVRLRREFVADSVFSNVQFLFTVGGKGIDEALVLHLKATNSGDPMQISLENEVTAGAAADVLKNDTPPHRIRLERYGKASLILARCADADQHAYEPVFRMAAERFARYRAAMGVRSTVTAELVQLKTAEQAAKSSK